LLVSEQWQQKALLQHIENLNPTTEKSAGKITNQILHNDRDHQAAVGGPNRRPTNPRWRTAAILKKTVKTLYLCNRLTDFDEIWYSDAYWLLTADLPLNFRIFENPKWRRPPS